MSNEKDDDLMQEVSSGAEKMFLGDPEEMAVEEGKATCKEERLAKFLASAGIASRRSCEELIEEGRVTVNGEAVTSPAYNVDPEKDEVRFEGHKVESHPQGKIYILLNKPVGYTCSAKDEHAERLVFELIPERFGRLFTVGRLDRDSEGMLILTNDGDYAQRVMHPSRQIIKRYYVECEGQFTTSLRRRLIEGFYDNDEFLRALNVEEKSVQKGHCALIFTLGDGRKREVRRLCKDVGLEVQLLRRVAIGALEMDEKLSVGTWRLMSQEEQDRVFARVELPEQAAAADPKPYWQKPERKPFDRNNRPYMASPNPEYKKNDDEGGSDRFDRRSFDRDRKPFDRDRKPFDRDRKPFDRDRKPFDRDRKPFDRDRKPFDRDRKPFDRDRKPFREEEQRPWYQMEEGEVNNSQGGFERENSFGGERKSFSRDRKPFDRDRKPFDRDRKPFDRDRKPFDRDRKPFDRDRKPFGRENGEMDGESRPMRNHEEGSFGQERSGFGWRREGGFGGKREGGFGGKREGGFGGKREGGFGGKREGGFGGKREGGFGKREGGFGKREGGFGGKREGGFGGKREGGFGGKREGGFGKREGGFGGKREGGFGKREGGFGKREGGFGKRDSGFGGSEGGRKFRGNKPPRSWR